VKNKRAITTNTNRLASGPSSPPVSHCGPGHEVPKMPNAMTDLDFDNSGNWGRLVSESRDHGQSVYELDFGGGNKVFTFVTWTLEERGRRAHAASQLK